MSSGTYSYSVVSFNATCKSTSMEAPELTRLALVYLIVMVVFICLSVILVVVWIVDYFYAKRCKNREEADEYAIELAR